MAIYTKTSNGWEALAADTKAVSSFGSIIPDGNQNDEGTYTDDIGREWVWYEYSDASKSDLSVTLSGGLYRILVASGGGHGNANGGSLLNAGGDTNDCLVEADGGTYSIQVGKNFYYGVSSTTGLPDSQSLVYAGDNCIAGSRIQPMGTNTQETGAGFLLDVHATLQQRAIRPHFGRVLSRDLCANC